MCCFFPFINGGWGIFPMGKKRQRLTYTDYLWKQKDKKAGDQQTLLYNTTSYF